MDYLWTPWRYTYISDPGKDDRCIFCAALEANDDTASHIVFRGAKNFVILNRYPYTTGHVMVVPYEHSADFCSLPAPVAAEMMQLAQRVQQALAATYHPEGYNLGMNLGRCAGAGVAGHLHLHVLPRWPGDTNFMATIGETRMHPEELSETYRKLRAALNP